MAILKWVEYKITCDACNSDIIGYDGMETRTAVKEAYKFEFGRNPIPGKMFCTACIESGASPAPFATIPDFGKAKAVCFSKLLTR